MLLPRLVCHAPVVAFVTVRQLVQDDGDRAVNRVVVQCHSSFVVVLHKPGAVYDPSTPVLSPLAEVLHGGAFQKLVAAFKSC